MPRQQATRSMSLTSQESYSAVIIADMIAEVPNQIDHPDIEQGIKAEKHPDGKNSTPKKEKSILDMTTSMIHQQWSMWTLWKLLPWVKLKPTELISPRGSF
ncbi:hypothetical protein CEXT_22221 [Caerostris extrusa]|uniref:Uncharacterized protein n=1 Tax=Caerostris extrusa TaxID=172846 RepID=A0AAV4Y8D3_CAEEX|nr:hypothetical protein CEXT_22221 [Caerostris extrusa]